MSFANGLISELMSKKVRCEARGIVDFDEPSKEEIKKQVKHKYEFGHDPLVSGSSLEIDLSKGRFSTDYMNLPHPAVGVRILVYDEIPGVEPFGLKGKNFELLILPDGRVQVYLPYHTTRSAQDSFRNYVKGLHYKSVSFRMKL